MERERLTREPALEMLVLRARRGLSHHDDALTRAALVRYLTSGTPAGVSDLTGAPQWTDGEWVWDDRDIHLVRQLDSVPWDEPFTRRVLTTDATSPR